VGDGGDLTGDVRLQVGGVGEAPAGRAVGVLYRLAEVYAVQARLARDVIRRPDEEEPVIRRHTLAAVGVADQQRPVGDVPVVIDLADTEAPGRGDADERTQVRRDGVNDLTARQLGGQDAARGQHRHVAGVVQHELVNGALRAGVAGGIDGIGAFGEVGEGEAGVEVREAQ